MGWYKKAAAQGDVPAQFNLGVMYAHGQGVWPDELLAQMWFILAAETRDADAIENRDQIEGMLSPKQNAKARAMAKACAANTFKDC
ncbi:MAG: hypothetical protein AAF221_01230 [Pseudomonadota bacterium]